MIRTVKLPEHRTLQVWYNDQVYNPKYSSVDTIVLADAILQPKDRVIDVATGSGVIALSLKYLNPDVEVLACDIDPEAIKVIDRNKYSMGLEIETFKNDLLSGVDNVFDMIVANLPTYTEKQMEEEAGNIHGPKIAYYAGKTDGLKLYKRLFAQSKDLLDKEGTLVCECQSLLQDAFLKAAQEAGFVLVAQSGFGYAFKLK
jgi:release factor glutamine methyltransferase